MTTVAAWDLSPLLRMALLGAVLALVPLAWIALRHRGSAARLRALTALTLFLCFDLVLFGAFTRLTDSGLGCPDWPGCYGNASPLGAQHHIAAAQSLLPDGPVTHAKAWIEMLHRYFATAVGVLITVLAAMSWRLHRRGTPGVISSWWAGATLLWVCMQGAFGALTVTMKLYPAIVTAHLLGGLGLLALLAAQSQAFDGPDSRPLALPAGLRRGLWALAALAVAQMALGGWVSTNYAVLACGDFPTCQGRWWPDMDFQHGFTLQRALGNTGDGDYLPFAALTAIHFTHRLMALAVLAALVLMAWRLWRLDEAQARRWACALLAVGGWQLASGVSNVVLGWPLLAAVGHTGGAAALIVILSMMLMRAHRGARQVLPARRGTQPALAPGVRYP
ncbi:COX15/CtaA family protein [Azohydromonas lata]|uniref:COX15/CtaA family protein n=1 Tax=Azohydromonas lata TaxID=45677 RepID=A0ABU5IC22_9BURK|nr:COX15/CtaA family protein [Azohydromonas lata]MDZ5456487.1 COX15/CtaA family protein [Azohydromonas lata]